MKEVTYMYNFDKVIERRGTNCAKWDGPIADYNNENIIPMWVADMDFEVAEPIRNRIASRILHPVFGYARKDWDAFHAIVKHFNEKCNHTITCEDVIVSTGVVYSIDAAVRLFSEVGDKIMIHAPAYPPFRGVPTGNGRIIVDTQMKIEDGKYVFDFEDMEAKVDGCKMFILCNPQNPTGRVFTKEELEQVAAFCEKHNLMVICDEIHADFIFDGKAFVPFMDINEWTKNNTITCVSCTKTFNLAGLKVSAVFIKNPTLREVFNKGTSSSGLQSINIFGLEAVKAAYEECEPWLKELVTYLQANRDYTLDYIEKNIPQIKVLKSEGTYLLWLDMSCMNVECPQKELLEKTNVFFNDGKTFGKEYSSFVRMNLACPRSQVTAALEALKAYFD